MQRKNLFIIIFTGFLIAGGLAYSFLNKPTNPIVPIMVDNEIVFETIDKQNISAHFERKNYAITNAADWIALWDKIYFDAFVKPALPEIDFNKYTVVATFQGAQNSGGYDFEIVKIGEKNDIIYVFIRETVPGKNCFVTQALSNPHHIVAFQRTDKKIEFRINKEVKDCK